MKNRGRNPTYALALCYTGMVCLAIAVNLMPIFLTTIRVELGGNAGLTDEQLGRISAITFAGLVGGILVTGPLADRWGGRPFSVLGTLLIGLGLGLIAISPSYRMVLVAVFVMGLGAGILDMVLSPIVAALRPDTRGTALNWLHSFYAIGTVITVVMGALALRCGIGWRPISLALVAVPLVVALGFANLDLPPLVSEEQGRRTALRELCSNSSFLAINAAILLGGALELGMAQWLPAYAEMSLGFSKWTGSVSLLGFSAAMAVGRIVAGLIGRRLDPIRLTLGCCWTSAVLFLLACFAPWPAVALAASVGVGLAGSCLWPATLGVAADRFPRGGASMFGLLAAFGNLGGILMPWLVGVTADWSSLRLGLATSTACPLLMALVLLWMQRRPAAELRERHHPVVQAA
ncbi:MAG TPA: MFS transporter [Terriglobales bacterium]|nr:MFS transporter [Terriglobales bacterium]